MSFLFRFLPSIFPLPIVYWPAKMSFLDIAPEEIEAMVEATLDSEDTLEDIVAYTQYKRHRIGCVWNK